MAGTHLLWWCSHWKFGVQHLCHAHLSKANYTQCDARVHIHVRTHYEKVEEGACGKEKGFTRWEMVTREVNGV